MKFDLKVLSLGTDRKMASQLARELGAPVEVISEEIFPDGEMKIQCKGAVQGFDVLISHSLIKDEIFNPSENIFRLLITAQLLRDLGAHSLSVVAPYLSYSRSDERRGAGEPLTLKYLAQLLESSGVQRFVTLDAHNISAFQNAFRCEVKNLECSWYFSNHLKNENFSVDRFVVLSPDFGGIKRAERFRDQLQLKLGREVQFAYLEKFRSESGMRGQMLVGDVKDACVFIYDDLISTGQTILRAAKKCRDSGAQEIFVVATHGLFSSHPEELLYSDLIDQIYVTDSNPHLLQPEFAGYPKLQVLPCVPVLVAGLKELLPNIGSRPEFEPSLVSGDFNEFV